MAETKWTPGPWKTDSPRSLTGTGIHCAGVVSARVAGFGTFIVAGIDPFQHARSEIQKADAHLIASAPDLYAALEPFAEQDECGIGVLVGEREEHTAQCDECQRILAARAALAKARGK